MTAFTMENFELPTATRPAAYSTDNKKAVRQFQQLLNGEHADGDC